MARKLAGAAIACLGIFPALADTACNFGSTSNFTRATIQPHDEAFAEIVIDNHLTSKRRDVCELTIYGVTVEVEYSQGPGTMPDDFTTTVPPGFRADPPEITINDGASDSVLIWLDGGESS